MVTLRLSLLFYLFLSLIFQSAPNSVYGQAELIYKRYYPENGTGKPLPEEEHKTSMYSLYRITDDNYATVYDVGNLWITSYEAESNLLSNLYIDGSFQQYPAESDTRAKVSFSLGDSTFLFRGYECLLLRAKYDDYYAEKYYTVRQFFNPDNFKDFGFGSWAQELEYVRGGLLLYSRSVYPDYTVITEFEQLTEREFGKKDFSPEQMSRDLGSRFGDQVRIAGDALARNYHNTDFKAEEVLTVQVSGWLRFDTLVRRYETAIRPPHFHFESIDNGEKLYYHNGQYFDSWERAEQVTYREARRDINTDMSEPFSEYKDIRYFGDRGFSVRFAHETRKDSLQLTRLVLHREGKDIVYYVDMDKGFIRLLFKGSITQWLLDYKFKNSVPYSTRLMDHIYEAELQIEGWQVNLPLDTGYFHLPDSLAHTVHLVSDQDKAIKLYESARLHSQNTRDPDSLSYALELFEQALALDPGNAKILNGQGTALLAFNDPYSAIVSFTQALELDPDNTQARVNLAIVKSSLGDLEPARRDLNKAIALDPSSALAHDKLGDVHYALKEKQEALENFKKAFELAPDNNNLAAKAGVLYYELNVYDSAIIYLDKANNMGDIPGHYQNFLGLSYYRVGNYDSARVHFESVMQREPNHPNAASNLAYTLLNLEEDEAALRVFNQVLAQDSVNASAWNQVGLVHYRRQDYASASLYFQRAMTLAPEVAVYAGNLGDSRYYEMKYSEAIEAFNRVIRLTPESGEAYLKRGLARVRANDAFNGCKDLKQAEEMNNENATRHYQEHCAFLKED